jgi:hypothetical protein
MCGYTGFKNLPLWYPHYNNRTNYDGFRDFGGWSISSNPPIMKQYLGTTSICGTSIDKNWAPKMP